MGFEKRLLPGLFVILDVAITVVSLQFFSPFAFHNGFASFYENIFTLDKKHKVDHSPYEFLAFMLIRMISIGVATILLAFNKESIVKALSLPCIGFTILVYVLTMIKMLIFSENPAMFTNPGLWFVLAWTIISTSIFCLLWHVVLANSKLHCSRLFYSDENGHPVMETNESAETSEDTERLLITDNKTRVSTFKQFKGLLSYCFVECRWFLGGFFFLFAYCAIRLFIPYYAGVVIAYIVHYSHGMEPVIDSAIIVGILILASAIVGGFCGGCFDYGTSLVSRRVRRDLFATLVKQDIAFFDAINTDELMNRLKTDCNTLANSVALNLKEFFRSSIMLIGSLIVMFTLSWRLTLVNFIVIPINLFITKVYGSFFNPLNKREQDTIDSANHSAEEVLSTMRTVRSFGCENHEIRRFEKMLDNTLSIGKKRAIGCIGKNWTDELTYYSIPAAVVMYGGYLTVHKHVLPEHFISFIVYQLLLGEYLHGLCTVFTGLRQSIEAYRKVFEYINRMPTIGNDGQVTSDVQGDMMINSVSFKNPNRHSEPALKNLSLELKHGETIALVGPIGGDKSSIISLIERFYEPEAGEITLDGHPIHDYHHIHYHQKVALVPQDPAIYDRSIMQNIAYGFEGAAAADIIQAARIANIHDFVVGLEKGYDTQCGEKGVQLSGGQRRRIAIARALFRNPAVLILEEATTPLDTESENIVQEVMQTCSGKRTLIVVAHKLSTIERANQIAVINNGEVVQTGNHNELMKVEEGLYYHLVTGELKHGI